MVAQGGSIKRWMAVLGLLLLGWGLALELPPLPLPPVPLPKPPVLPPPVTPSPSDQGLQRFYGQVTLSDGQALLVGGVPLLGSSPWMVLLVPGMAVEVEGSWEGAGFRLRELRIVAPARFSYYRGPGAVVGQGGYRALELWTVEEGNSVRTLALRTAPDGAGVYLVAYWDGQRFLALPPGLRPPAPGLAPGWVEGTGVYRDGRVVWARFKPFP